MHENVQIYIKDKMPDGIDIQSILDKINLVSIKNCHLRLDPTTCTKQLSIDIKSETRLLFQF